MKNKLFLALSAMFFAISLSSCGSNAFTPTEDSYYPTEVPTDAPTETPTEAPTEEPSVVPTRTPTEDPYYPTEEPYYPTEEPYYPTEEPYYPTESPSYGGEQEIINHLLTYGYGEYHIVTTNPDGTSLGYNNGTYFLGCMTSSGSLSSTYVGNVYYMGRTIYGSFTLEQNGYKLLDCDLVATVSNHKMGNLEISRINVNNLNSSATESAAKIMIISAQAAIDLCSTYLSRNGLPYLF